MKILVTGGAGFIGSHLIEKLLSLGHEVRVLDNLSTGSRSILPPDVELIVGDARENDACARATQGVQAIFHLAALTSIPLAQERPVEAFAINVGGTIRMLKAAVDAKVGRFILASSCAVYGEVSLGAVAEGHPGRPLSFYAVTKRTCELYARSFTRSLRLPTISLRFFNVYGPRQRALDSYAGVIALFLQRARSGKPLTLYGDGSQTRDLLYVQDAVDALAAALQRGTPGEVYNVGTGRPTRILDLAKLVGSLVPSHAGIETAPSREGDIRHSLADVSRAGSELGFRANVPLEEGLRHVLAWALATTPTAPRGA
jgi:UDP-glucose 4-epimerase